MKMYEALQRSYDELERKALAVDATQDDINALGEWFDSTPEARRYWDGESYHVTGDIYLYPVFRVTVDDDGDEVFDIIGWTFSADGHDRIIYDDGEV